MTRRRDEVTRVHVKEKGKNWAEGGVEREHMAPLVLEGERESPAGVGEERGGRQGEQTR